jgi:O-antigen/teichoic acid export membrane protein
MPDARPGAAAKALTQPAARARTDAQPVGRVRLALAGWRDPQHRDGLALVLSSAISSAVGLLYWVVAARLFTPDEVGVNSTLISTMTLLGIAAQLNLGSALLRFIPVAGRSARALVIVCYGVAAAVGCAVGAVFAGGAAWWAGDLVDALGSGPLLAFFALATPVWALFAMQDYVLTASRRATLVPLENLVFALVKIGLLAVGTLVVFRGVIAVSWALATAVIVLVVTVYLMRILRPAAVTASMQEEIRPRNVARFVSANWVGGLCTDVVEFGLPLIVLALLDPDSAATYGMAWAIAYALYLVTHGMSQSMVAHVSANPEGLRAAARAMVVKALTLIVPGVVVIVPGAGLILSIFGPHYAETGTTLLVLCALSAVPNVVVVAAIAVARVQQRRAVIIAVPASVAVIVISLALTLMPRFGLTGIGVALLVGQSAVAAAILLIVLGTRRWTAEQRE